ncbi:MAG: hypothetical protein WDM77_13950 [Steroidobacteraceae bacterium]
MLAALQALEPRVQSLQSRYVHFIDTAPLSSSEQALLAKLLTYGAVMPPSPQASGAHTQVVLVVPRAGTISPWSSKATDIAQVCGLGAVRRIERGIRYELVVSQPLDALALNRIAATLFDRMTEMAVSMAEEAAQLFAHHAPP